MQKFGMEQAMHFPDFRLWQAAIILAEELNFSRAADRLHIVQPTLSKQILELEQQLGFPLFLRNSQSVRMTDAGEQFVREAREVIFHAERALNLARSAALGSQSVIHVGKSPYVDPYLVSTFSAVTLPLYPGIHIQFSSLLAPELEQRLLAGKLDMAIITAPSDTPKLTQTELSRAGLYVAMCTSNIIARKSQIAIQDLHLKDWIMFERHVHPAIYDKIFAIAQHEEVQHGQLQHVMTAEEAAQMLHEGQRVAILTRTGAWRIAEHGITIRPLLDESLVLTTSLVMRSDNDSRMLSQFTKAYVKRLSLQQANQMKLRLVS
jgi:DNA-binding transcriptional LysR family regulator